MKLYDVEKVTSIDEYFSAGVYCRVMHIPAGMFVIGHKHLTRHMNVLLKGKMRITIGEETREIEAPYIFEALEGSVKAVITHTDCSFMNIHPTKYTDINDIKKDIIDEEFVPNNLNLVEEAKERLWRLEQ